MNKLIKKIQNFAFQQNLWSKNDKIIVGVSGGPDSVCLLDMFTKIASKYNLELRVAHINYGIRKKDANRDEEITRTLSEKYELELDVLRFKTDKFTDSKNLENKLRDIRYTFFNKLKKEHGFDLIAVAHNQDDQAETILMRLLRGSGLQGLSAIQPKNNDIIRPLLETSRQEIISYVTEEKIEYGIDITNKDTKFLRNKIRHNLIPYLEKNYNPKAKEVLSRSASSIATDYDFIEKSCQKKISKIIKINSKTKSISFSVADFEKLPTALQKQGLRIIITKLKKNIKDIETANINEIIKIIKSTKKKNQILNFKGLKLERKNDKVSMIKV
ncbi:tRNA lysidine(34) synthetase TilS [Patescibacteria group bacterium]